MTTKTSPQQAYKLIIRDMTVAEIPASIRIIRSEYFPSMSRRGFDRLRKSGKVACQVGVIDDVIIAVIVYLLAKEFIKIFILAVVQEWKGRGVGRRMLEKTELRAEGVETRTKVIATVPESLLPSGTKYLRHMGYTGTGVEIAENKGEIDLVIMEKPIIRTVTSTEAPQKKSGSSV